MRGLAEEFERELREVIEQAAAEDPAYSPSDFPLAQLDESELDRIFETIAEDEQG